MPFLRPLTAKPLSTVRNTFALKFLSLTIGLLTLSAVRAEEPFGGFLDGLRERAYFDTALDYLDELAGHGLRCTTVPYDRMQLNGGGIHCSTTPLIRDPA